VRTSPSRVMIPLAALALATSAPPVAAATMASAGLTAPTASASAAAVSDSVEAVATVERFRAALARGDSAAVLAMLAPDAIVLESGSVESRAEYRQHHLPADIEHSRAIPGEHKLMQAVVHGDVAWVSSTSITQGKIKERAVNSAGAELIVLSRRDRQSPWLVRAIHWSSRRRAP
jgi:ketosteroid isomerase-like protein